MEQIVILAAGALFALFFGTLGGGLVQLFLEYRLSPQLEESAEARKKVQYYAKPLWFECNELAHRLIQIQAGLKNPRGNIPNALKLSPRQASSLEWFTKDGYFVTSTAYLIASVSAWITLFERDVVFLQFGDDELTNEFSELIERYKIELSYSVLWYHYVSGIAEELIVNEMSRPLSFSGFSRKLFADPEFRDYYDQLFQYLVKVAEGKYEKQIANVLKALDDIKAMLSDNVAIPAMKTLDSRKERFDHYQK